MSKSIIKVWHPDETLDGLSDPSIFLAGPSPRSVEVYSWRPAALDILAKIGFSGSVFIPERRDWSVGFHYDDQIEWELSGLDAATVIVCWVPRNMEKMPALTTNVEFGLYVKSNRLIYGRPPCSPHTRYLDYLYNKFTGRQPNASLQSTLEEAVEYSSKMGKSKELCKHG